MSCPNGAGRTLNQFAVVSYIPGPLAAFLDRLRLEIDPDSNPHAHVTALPPRPLTCPVADAISHLNEGSHTFPPFEIVLGDVEIFDISNVVYIRLARGERELRALHERLNANGLVHRCPFPFHPHITIAQDLAKPAMDRAEAETAARLARERWAQYGGSRSFTVDSLSFVQNVAPGIWLDLARIPLAIPVPAGH